MRRGHGEDEDEVGHPRARSDVLVVLRVSVTSQAHLGQSRRHLPQVQVLEVHADVAARVEKHTGAAVVGAHPEEGPVAVVREGLRDGVDGGQHAAVLRRGRDEERVGVVGGEGAVGATCEGWSDDRLADHRVVGEQERLAEKLVVPAREEQRIADGREAAAVLRLRVGVPVDGTLLSVPHHQSTVLVYHRQVVVLPVPRQRGDGSGGSVGGGWVEVVVHGDVEGELLLGKKRVVHPLETVHEDRAVLLHRGEEVVVAAEDTSDAVPGLEDEAIVEVDAVCVEDVEEDAHAVAQHEDDDAEGRAVVDGRDLQRRRQIPPHLWKIDHDGSGDGIPARRAIPLHFH